MAPVLVGAVYFAAPRELVLEFDQAMDQASLPVLDGSNVAVNADGTDRHGKPTPSWDDATHLRLPTIDGGPPVPTDTTECSDTSGIQAAALPNAGAATWSAFPVVTV